MLVDLKKAKENFIKYTEGYDLNNKRIKRKQEHSIRVMEISRKIAEGLKLDEEKIEIATLIGLLHDIGRFKQVTEFDTFSDINSFDHGEIGAIILENKLREDYIKTDKY